MPRISKVIHSHFRSFFIMTLLVLSLSSCSTMKKYQALPQSLEDQVTMQGFPHVRSWADAYSKELEASAAESIHQERQSGHVPKITNVLALSGGGSDGAFGAGLLCGWTKTGTRPTFKLVTGISTGALIAPFAFLGPQYDDRLANVYTHISDKTIYKPFSMFSIFMSVIKLQSLPSLATNEPLAKLIEREVTMDMLHQIAIQHRQGRRLLIGTTQLNAQRLVIWNMGEIAEAGTPEALALFRKILLASSALPVSFPPQFFDVMADGKRYQEMHVDGGLGAQVMLYENAILPFSLAGTHARINRPRVLYIVRNQKIYPEWENVSPTLKDIAVRSIGTLTKSQGIGDLYRLYTYSARDNIEFNLTFIPKHFTEKAKTPFDNHYMRDLFIEGYKVGSSQLAWQHAPPGYIPA